MQMFVDCTWLPLGRCAMLGLLESFTLVTGAPVVRIAPESKTAHLLMLSMLMLTVQRRAAAARAYGWVGVGREDSIFWFSFIILVLPPLAGQKLLYQP
jgi:hypothetical protein